MKSPRFRRFLAGAFATSLLASSFGSAQMSVDKVVALDRTLQHVRAAYNKLDSRHQKMLDGYANIVHLADVWHTYGMRLTDPSFVARAKMGAQLTSAPPPVGSLIRASNPATDVAYSSFAGFTQSETSTARCGNNVVVGFNDSGSVFETPYFYTGTGGQAFSGAAYSTNGGASFTDVGPINPGPGNGNFLGGDPGVNCSDANTFYYSQIFDYTDSSFNFFGAVSVNKSTDGGKTWGDPIPAISKDGSHLLDKPWSTIDPSNKSRMFVSYTDFDFSQTNSCGTNYPIRIAIEFVESDDGGATWSANPTVAIEVCGNAAVQGSQMAVDSHGTMYISWVNLGSNFPFGPRSIQISSLKSGTLSAPVTVEANVQPGGDLRESTDGGNTWGFAPRKVNSDIQSRLGSGHDHYQSAIAVDSRGFVGVCWYDRRHDAENFAIKRHCGESTDGGFSFSDADIGMPGFAPTHGNDVFINSIYMGDYDQLTSDFTNANSGFVGAFENQTNRGNPDVFVHKMN